MALIDALKGELSNLMSVRAQNYENSSVNGQSNPVEAVAVKRQALTKRLERVERQVRAVKRLDDDLCGSDLRIQQMGGILRLKYFRGESLDYVVRKMAISLSTYWRRNSELLKKAKKYLGEE